MFLFFNRLLFFSKSFNIIIHENEPFYSYSISEVLLLSNLLVFFLKILGWICRNWNEALTVGRIKTELVHGSFWLRC